MAEPLAPELAGHIDGFAIRFAGEEVAVIPSFMGGCTALRNARWALRELERVLAKERQP